MEQTDVVAAGSDMTLVATRAQVPEGCMRRFESKGRSWVIFNDGGEFVAAADVCPHKGAPLSAGEFADGYVVCPLHGWEFDVRGGECVSMPDWRGLDLATVVVEGELVYVDTSTPPLQDRSRERSGPG